MKLIIQIPCYNEETVLQATLEDLPKKIEGVDTIETLIVDDGSTDSTVEVARENGANHIVSFTHNRGLARAFAAGIEKCLELGADIIVNTDADNQYKGQEITRLIRPILQGEADIVVGDRQTDRIKNFSSVKKLLQKIGSALVRRLSNARIADTVSGFRAYSRESAMHINILSEFSYTIENLIQLGIGKFRIVSVPIGTNVTLRKSRLHKGNVHFVLSQLRTIIRSYAMYKALKVFTYAGLVFLLPGLFLCLRFVYYFIFQPSRATGHIQSLIFAAVLIIVAFILFMLGIVADLISDNRKLIEEVLFYRRKENWMK
jgi:glycosyltransferase involved in cell wall biosynthesis